MPHDRAAGIRIATVMALALVASAQAAEPTTPRVYAHGSRNSPTVALTFDLCPTRKPIELASPSAQRGFGTSTTSSPASEAATASASAPTTTWTDRQRDAEAESAARRTRLVPR